MHDDWHMERAVAAIRLAAQVPGEPAVADALAAAIAKKEGRERVAARKRRRQEVEATRRHEEEAAMSVLQVELGALRTTDPEMNCSRRWNTSHLTQAVVLLSIGVVMLRITASELIRISPYLSAAHGPKGFKCKEGTSASARSKDGPVTVHSLSPVNARRKPQQPFWTTSKWTDSTGHSFVWTTVSPEGDCLLFTRIRRPRQHS
jgi:hypothetical protein